ncbi:MAG: GNAT family N-acetyltransferase [Negativicutes bacterium]
MPESMTIRNISRGEMSRLIDWAADEGWNPGLHDAACFYETDPRGFFIGELRGVPVGCISAVAYNDAFGFVGFYIVKPEFRGRGYGYRLWQAAMEYMKGRNVGLDGVVAQQENYQKSGFHFAYNNIRYEVINLNLPMKRNRPSVVSLSQVAFDELAAYDEAVFSVERKRFLQPWISQPGGVALGSLSDGRLSGYGMLRSCRSGCKIGPLFADTAEVASELFQALVQQVPGTAVYLDVPAVNPAAMALAEKHQMQPVFETARMYTGRPPKIPLDKVFGVTSFELG